LEKLKRIGLFLLLFFLVFTVTEKDAWAISLTFDPTSETVEIGQSVNVDIVISGMDSADLAEFDFNINFSDTILSLDYYELGSGLGDIGLGDADDWSLGDQGAGIFNLAEVSYLWDFGFQQDTFVLATFMFTGVSAGNSGLGLSDVVLGDELGDPLTGDLFTGSISVGGAGANPVPGPSTLLLTGLGICSAVRLRKRKIASS
jgi:hypothetical protein